MSQPTTADSPRGPQASEEVDERTAWRALWAIVIGFFMILIDTTIVSVATPTLMVDLKASISQVLWVTSAYLLAYAVPLLITGRLGDRFGPRKLYLIGLAGFSISSALCGLAGSVEHLIIFRALQGLAGALMTPQTMAIITRLFPAARRGPAMGLWGGVAGLAILVGPLAGGLLVDSLGWPSIFYVNVPIGIIGFIAAWRAVPKLSTHPHRFDLIGVALSAIGLFCFVFGLEEGENYDWGTIWGPITVWGLIIFGLVVFAVFIWWQAKTRSEPLVPLELFKDRNFSAANLAITAMGLATTSMVFPLMLFNQVARGLSPTQAALLMLPMALISGGLAPVVGRLMLRVNPRRLALAGFAILALAIGAYAFFMRPGWSVLWLLIPSALLGVGNSGIWGPLSMSATRNLRGRQAGAGSGVYNTTRQIGSVVGSAAVAVLMQERLSKELAHLGAGAGQHTSMAPTGHALPEAIATPFTHAMSQAMILPAAAAVLGLLACLLMVRNLPEPHRA